MLNVYASEKWYSPSHPNVINFYGVFVESTSNRKINITLIFNGKDFTYDGNKVKVISTVTNKEIENHSIVFTAFKYNLTNKARFEIPKYNESEIYNSFK